VKERNSPVTHTQKPQTLVFDLETKRLADEVGGWSNICKMGMSVAVTYSVEEDRFTVYTEQDVESLIRAINEAGLVVGFNVLRFDYEVLRPYTLFPIRSEGKTTDLMIPLFQTLGFRPKLEDLAAATLGAGKQGDGLDAVRWFREGKMDQLIAYCKQDVQVTHDLYQFGKERGFVLLRDRYKGSRRVPVKW